MMCLSSCFSFLLSSPAEAANISGFHLGETCCLLPFVHCSHYVAVFPSSLHGPNLSWPVLISIHATTIQCCCFPKSYICCQCNVMFRNCLQFLRMFLAYYLKFRCFACFHFFEICCLGMTSLLWSYFKTFAVWYSIMFIILFLIVISQVTHKVSSCWGTTTYTSWLPTNLLCISIISISSFLSVSLSFSVPFSLYSDVADKRWTDLGVFLAH